MSWDFIVHNNDWGTEEELEKLLQEKPTTIEQLRHLLNQWVELDQRRHPEFQAKELLEQSKEAIKNSRNGH